MAIAALFVLGAAGARARLMGWPDAERKEAQRDILFRSWATAPDLALMVWFSNRMFQTRSIGCSADTRTPRCSCGTRRASRAGPSRAGAGNISIRTDDSLDSEAETLP